MTRWILISTLAATIHLNQAIAAANPVPRLEAYVTAEQVDSLFSTDENCKKALSAFQDIGVTKIYLDTFRCGYIPGEKVLIHARDFFRENGIEVSAGMTTTYGENFGTPSDRSRFWLNYQTEKTQMDLSNHFRKIASFFDEIMIDDFFSTNDESEISENARGNRSWPEYRLDLMCDIARRCVIQPAREANPNVSIILKYPQWYDRFHCFGYDAAREPAMFDRIWVGTETRNPETQRYGFVMPTQGYINYSWLRSIAGPKTGGAWFDFGDCTPECYLMQAYQSVLAGAEEIVLFEAGSLVDKNPCIEPLLQRHKALFALGEILKGRKSIGLTAYKPPHSDGSDLEGAANLYVYDYLATLGLSPIPVASAPDNVPAVFLPRQAVADAAIIEKVHKWLAAGTTILTTPDFLTALGDCKLVERAGYEYPIALKTSKEKVDRFRVDGKELYSKTAIQLRDLEKPPRAEILCAGVIGSKDIPLLTRKKDDSGGQILVLNLDTFTHEEFGPGREEFLPPRPLSVKDWPAEVVNRIRDAVPTPRGLEITGPNNIGIYYYEGNLLVLANFNESPATLSLKWKTPPKNITLHNSFPHAEGASMEKQNESIKVTVPAWELVIIEWKKN